MVVDLSAHDSNQVVGVKEWERKDIHHPQAHKHTKPHFRPQADLEVTQEYSRQRRANQIRDHRQHPLRNNHILDLFPRQAFPLKSDIPIRLQRSADPDEKKHRYSREQRREDYKRIHSPLHLPRFHNAEEEEAYRYLRQAQRNKRLNPIPPPQRLKSSPLRISQVEFVSAEAVDDFRCYHAGADDCGHLCSIAHGQRCEARGWCYEYGLADHSDNHDPVIPAQIARQARPDPYSEDSRCESAGDEGPADGEEGPASILISTRIWGEGFCFHGGGRASERLIQGSEDET